MRYSEISESYWGTALGEKVDTYLKNTPGISALENVDYLLSIIPTAHQQAAKDAIAVLVNWRDSARKIYRVIAIANHSEDDIEDLDAARAYVADLSTTTRPLGNHWSRAFHGDHYGHMGAGIDYDPDAEGFPVLLAATVDDSSVRWGTTILHNIIYPHEEEITVMGDVLLRYAEVDDDFAYINRRMHSGPYDEDY